MKRIFVGFFALTSLVGTGAAGVYVAHSLLPQPVQTAEDTPEPVATNSREMTPIRLARQPDDEQPAAGNPFGSRSRAPQAEVVSEVRNAVAEERTSIQEDRYAPAETPDAQPQDDIPNASEVTPTDATQSVRAPISRVRGGGYDSRYPEQPAAAELPVTNDEPAEDSTEPTSAAVEEPEHIDAPATERPAIDRFGRPLNRTRQNPRQPTVAEQAAEEPQGTEPAADETQPQAGETAPQDTPREEPASTEEGTGRPGDPQLNGSQAPALTIEKTAPAEVQIGKPAKFLIKVRNAGTATAHEVEIQDVIPQGTQLIETKPAATRGPQGELVWQVGSLKPGEESQVELQLMPTAEGEIGSVATVHFRAVASVRTLATKPMLTMEAIAPAKVMKGEEFKLRIKISNPGTGAATGVILNETVPEGLTHPAGGELEFEVGTLKPGETRELDLVLKAAAAGHLTNVVSAQADANLQAETRSEMEILAPDLQVSMAGAKKRYLERKATYNLTVSNPGTASAKDVELVAVLPKELKFVEANNGGQFDAATHSVYWSLEELPPQETGTVTLTTMPLQPGDTKLVVKGKAKQGLSAEQEEAVSITGVAAINFQLSDASDPIETGGQTNYEVRVTNQGTKAANNVRVVAVLPAEMKPVSAEGPVRYAIDGQRVIFEPLKQLAAKADTTYAIKVEALAPGDLRMHVQITTDESPEPITREESTRVFGDE